MNKTLLAILSAACLLPGCANLKTAQVPIPGYSVSVSAGSLGPVQVGNVTIAVAPHNDTVVY
jgi:hypothetical protein